MERKFAKFNEDRTQRFVLGRIWDEFEKQALVIGLNPSTANESDNDPTIKSVIRILKHNGYGGLWMMNLFNFVTPYPEELKNKATLYDLQLCMSLIDKYYRGKDIIFAWGAFETHGRDKEMIKRFGAWAYCMGKNKDGSPKHPLYLKSNTELVKWS